MNLGVGCAVCLDMDTEWITKKFQQLGARAKVRPWLPQRWRPVTGPVMIDIGTDRRGEYFDIQTANQVQLEVLDVQPRDRHLLLMVRQAADRVGTPEAKSKFLCGHDERHWFVAGIPESASVSSVITAKEALKPAMVRQLESGLKGKRQKRHRRRTDTFLRQGEWFFVKASGLEVPRNRVLRNEPLRRGRGKPHWCEYLFRDGGTTVYVCRQYPNGLTDAERKSLYRRNPSAVSFNWTAMQRDPTVFVKGRVCHADHATICLEGWHRVLMNTESESRAMQFMAFLD